MTPNVTFDVYRGSNAPPNPPDVAGQKGYLIDRFRNIKPPGSSTMPYGTYTHILRIALGVDVRDGPTGGDTLYIPNQNGTSFAVKWIGREGRGTPLDHKVVYLVRSAAVYPGDQL